MKLKFKRTKAILLAMLIVMSFGMVVNAASYNFTYDFKHQLAMSSKKKATRSTAKFDIYTTSNGGSDTYFTIQQYKYKLIGTNPYVASERINCKAKESGSCSFSTTKDTSYTYEFWKPTAIGYVVGSGTLTY